MQKRAQSYADVVYEVMKSAGRPLTFAEVFAAVNRHRPITTRDPKATIRNALTQGRQLVSLGDGRYGYLPQLLSGSLLRLVLTGEEAANERLVYTEEVRDALWPSFFENQKRRSMRPVLALLPGGNEVTLQLDFFGRGVWGSRLSEGLRRYLAECLAAKGDSLLILVVDAEVGRCELSHEPRGRREEAALAKRNRELADAARQLLRRGRSGEVPIWDLALTLLARGFYHAGVAPDPLEEVLRADPRIVYAGLDMWLPAEAVTPDVRASIRRREAMEVDLCELADEPLVALERISSALSFGDATERVPADTCAGPPEQGFGSVDGARALLRKMLAGSSEQVGWSKHGQLKIQA